jgi:prephenate dehydrogenase
VAKHSGLNHLNLNEEVATLSGGIYIVGNNENRIANNNGNTVKEICLREKGTLIDSTQTYDFHQG